jgi:hypothetical protein
MILQYGMRVSGFYKVTRNKEFLASREFEMTIRNTIQFAVVDVCKHIETFPLYCFLELTFV